MEIKFSAAAAEHPQLQVLPRIPSPLCRRIKARLRKIQIRRRKTQMPDQGSSSQDPDPSSQDPDPSSQDPEARVPYAAGSRLAVARSRSAVARSRVPYAAGSRLAVARSRSVVARSRLAVARSRVSYAAGSRLSVARSRSPYAAGSRLVVARSRPVVARSKPVVARSRPVAQPLPPVADNMFQVVWRFLTHEDTWKWSKTVWRWIKQGFCYPFIQLWYGVIFTADHLMNFFMSIANLYLRFNNWARASKPFHQFLFMLWLVSYIVAYILFCALIYKKTQHSYEEQMREKLELNREKNFTGFANVSLIQPFTGNATFTDGVYWCTKTVSTMGHGDIVPKSGGAKVFTCMTVLMGLFVSTMVFQTINEAWSELEEVSVNALWLRNPLNPVVVWLHGGERNTKGARLKVRRWFAGLYAFLCMLFGVLLFKLQEHRGLLDAFYATVVSKTTLGYGDIYFVTE